jgi:hypothetical protein
MVYWCIRDFVGAIPYLPLDVRDNVVGASLVGALLNEK